MYGEASRRVREQRRKVGDVKSVPSELKLEAVPRRRFEARFDDVQLTLDLVPGAGDVGLVVVGWHAPVLDHDSAANDVEAQMARVDELRKAYVATARTASNWDTAWLLMNERPEELEEYLKLRPRMADFRERVALMRKTDEKVLAEQQWKRYHALRGKCERLLSARERFLAFKAVKDAAFATMKDADRILEKLFEHERSSAECISVDHTDADAAGVAVAELFPAIKVNMIVSKVAGVPTELLLSEEVSSLIDDAPRPHALEFRRYDYRRHSTTLKWEPLQVLRERGVFVDDPRVDRDMFVRACRAGDVEAVEDALARGSEVDAADSNGCTGLHLAAANDCVAVVDVLLKAGAHVDFRDHNRETPLFGAARRGSVNAAKRLMAKGAKTVGQIDRAGRSLLVHAVLSNSMPMLRLFLEVLPQDVDRWLPEKLWHWTPLHYAAAAGQAAVVAELLGAGASAHAASRAGESPLQLAAKSPVSAAAAKILADHIRAEPAQCVLAGGRDRGAVWLGARQAAYPKFATDRGFQSILSIYDRGQRDPLLKWIAATAATADPVEHLEVMLPKPAEDAPPEDEDDDGAEWFALAARTGPRMGPAVDFIHSAVERKRTLLLHCDSGVCHSFAVLLVYMLTKRKTRLADGVSHLQRIRHELELSVPLAVGLEGMQEDLDGRKMHRLEARLKKSSVLAIYF